MGEIKQMSILSAFFYKNIKETSESDNLLKRVGIVSTWDNRGVSFLSRFLSKALSKRNDVYVFAKEVQDKNPEYKFSFEKDPEGKWIKYTVEKIVAD